MGLRIFSTVTLPKRLVILVGLLKITVDLNAIRQVIRDGTVDLIKSKRGKTVSLDGFRGQTFEEPIDNRNPERREFPESNSRCLAVRYNQVESLRCAPRRAL